MSKQRYIKDSFWTDPYVEKLTPDEKLTFLYLLTNPQCNIAGVYEIRTKRIAYETGYDIEVIENILKRFERDSKVSRVGDYIIIQNHLKHQSLGEKTAEGINRIIKELPPEVFEMFEEKTISNSENQEYNVFSVKEQIPHIYPIQGVSKRPYSQVKLSKVINKVKYGEFGNVFLTDEELEKLKNAFGEQNTLFLIEELSAYMASKKKSYSSHYATLLNWGRRKVQNHQDKLQAKKRTIV